MDSLSKKRSAPWSVAFRTCCTSSAWWRMSPQRRPRRRGRSAVFLSWVRAEGWWEPAVRAGNEVRESSVLGYVRDLYGDVQEELRAPADGVVLFVTTSPAVAADGPVLGLGVDLSNKECGSRVE